jgi:TonB family protein
LGTGGDGEVDWIYLTEMPRLLNRDELVKNVLRFYPKPERAAGREARVVLSVHLNRDGAVSGAEIDESAGPHFDEAAIKVISTARFQPRSRRGPLRGRSHALPTRFCPHRSINKTREQFPLKGFGFGCRL